jgi:hypothetical protein
MRHRSARRRRALRDSLPSRRAQVSAVRVLGGAGILSAILSALAGFLSMPILLGAASTFMLVANVYALVTRRTP